MESFVYPPLVESCNISGVVHYDINIDVAPIEGGYHWKQVSITKERWNYGGIIDALVTYKYPNDKMQSVINNYLLDPTDEDVVKEFNEMQAWRKEAKEIAKQALEFKI